MEANQKEISYKTRNKSGILLSIIIPHYNRPGMLKKLLLSIPDIPWIQVIVVDDRSTEYLDEYAAVKSDFFEKRGYLFLDNPNKGTGSARNYGIKFAIGKWITFADSDDWFTEDFEKIIIEHLNDPDDLIYFIPTSVKLGGNQSLSTRHMRYRNIAKNYIALPTLRNEYLLRYDYWISVSKLINRKMIEENNILYDEGSQAEDMIFSAKCGGYAKRIKVCDETFYCITEHEGCISKFSDVKAEQTKYKEYIKYIKWVKSYVGWKGLFIMGWHRRYIHVMLAQVKRKLKAFITQNETDKGWIAE